jgi:hypothetical protein
MHNNRHTQSWWTPCHPGFLVTASSNGPEERALWASADEPHPQSLGAKPHFHVRHHVVVNCIFKVVIQPLGCHIRWGVNIDFNQ